MRMRKLGRSRGRHLLSPLLFFVLGAGFDLAHAQVNANEQVHSLKITILSTMLVGDPSGIGEWGFAALIDADGHKLLVDTGSHPNTVLDNARDLHVDLSDVQEVVLTHNHWDHVGVCWRFAAN
jgi:7,8-dihydropterin-6-yl-methyl-4-(beta-D-ribofuranosyl)aminobenzene 5'-phosphate synthase